jgi:AGCS family alanine or glycine:cation symporter
LFTGELNVQDGALMNPEITMLHARSFAEDVRVKIGDDNYYTGLLNVRNGRVSMSTVDQGSVYFTGKSLIHSAPLSSEAFKKGFLGEWGAFIIPISLLLFAFSTALAWAYYGDRAVVYLWGKKYVKVFQIVYVIMFFVASFTDTTIVWAFSGVTVAFMTLPNLIGILLLRKDVKGTIYAYWAKIQAEDKK